MKNLTFYFTVFTLVAIVGCTRQKPAYFGMYGDKIEISDSKSIKDLPTFLEGKDSINIKLIGKISKVCQTKGCWMSLPITEDENLFVKFKDYAFFMPKNSAGHEVVVEGIAYKETTSVKELQHLAEDEGQSKEEINAISSPAVRYTFLANGVIIK